MKSAEPVSNAPTPAPGSSASGVGGTPRGHGYLLGLLLVINLCNLVDRQVVGILAEPIKADLQLKDWQVGLMTGLGFVVVYTGVGLAVARLADRANRPRIIGVSVLVWSVFTALSGTAQTFLQLLVCRVGVGLGEAGPTPAAHSLIADTLPRARRGAAIALYSVGNPLGVLFGLALGGLVAQGHGWRTAFLVAAVPGPILAILALTTLKEPRDLRALAARRPALRGDTFATALKYLSQRPTFWLVCVGIGFATQVAGGLSIFTASYFLRSQADEVASLATSIGAALHLTLRPLGFLGVALGVVFGLSGAVGTWLGGYLGDRWGATDPRRSLWPAVLGTGLAPVFFIGGFQMDTPLPALGLLAIGQALLSMCAGPVYATVQSVTAPHLRATSAAVMLLLLNLVGTAMGPLIVGILSDLLQATRGAGESVRVALLSEMGVGWIAALLFFLALRTIRADILEED